MQTVMIIWHDAFKETEELEESNWKDIREFAVVQTTGFLLRQNRNCVVLAHEYHPANGVDEQASIRGYTVIPRKMIQEIKELTA